MLHKKWPLLFVVVSVCLFVLFLRQTKVKAATTCTVFCYWTACGQEGTSSYNPQCGKTCKTACTEVPVTVKPTPKGPSKAPTKVPTKAPTITITPTGKTPSPKPTGGVIHCGGTVCPSGSVCYQPPMPTCGAGACTQMMPPPKCISKVIISSPPHPPTPTLTPHPIGPTEVPIKCDQVCPIGTVCVLPPMPTCIAETICVAYEMTTPVCMTPTPTPPSCNMRSQGDANCDNVVNKTDFDILKASLQGYVGGNADFNGDGKINVVDYEIWRNTFYH